MKVLITGGAGFVGSHLAEACRDRGYQTHVVDNLSTGRRENVPDGVQFWEADITSDALVDIVTTLQPDVIFHQAAQSSVPVSLKHPIHDAHVNILGTLKLLEAARKANVKKVIYASSAAVYGNPASLPIDIDHAIQPSSFYGISKWVPELYLRVYRELYGLAFTVLRYANIYGPRQAAHGEGGVVAIFVDRVLKSEPLVIHGDGRQTRDFVYVTDVVEANLAAIERGDGDVLNVGTGIPTSILELVKTLEEVVEHPIPFVHADPRPGDIRYSYFNIKDTIQKLNWKPRVTLKEGLKETLARCGWKA